MQTKEQNNPLITGEEAQLLCENLNEKIIQSIKVTLCRLGIPSGMDEYLIEIPENDCVVFHPYLGDKVQVAKVTLSKDGVILTIYYHDWEEESDLNESNFSSLDLAKVLLQIEKAIGQ